MSVDGPSHVAAVQARLEDAIQGALLHRQAGVQERGQVRCDDIPSLLLQLLSLGSR